MENITLITPTGDRPLTFALCQRWIERQTLQPAQWIVVDDGKKPIADLITTDRILYIRREPREDDPRHTLLVNLKMALPLVKGGKVLIIEDDDYYSPNYVETMAAKLNKYEAAGIYNGRYYYLPTCANCRAGNERHASLATTGFRKSFLKEFSRLVNTKTGALDLRLWQSVNGNRRGCLFLDDDAPLYVAMKGVPGRKGRGGAHAATSWRYKRSPLDIFRILLRQWISNEEDFNIYNNIIMGTLKLKEVK